MEFSNDDIQSLVDLGLSIVQAKIFLTLIQTGTMKAQTISQLSKISRADVYRNLEKLHNIGLLERQIARPELFTAIQTQDALNILMERQSLKYKELRVKTANLLKKYQENKDQLFYSQFNFVFVPSREALIKRLNKAIELSREEIDVATSKIRLMNAGHSLYENLQKAWDRGVKGRAIIDVCDEKEHEALKEFWQTPLAEIRWLPQVPKTVMAMYDKKEVFIFTNPTAQLTESPALWSNLPSLVSMAEDYFESLWYKAMENPQYHKDEPKDRFGLKF